MSLMQKIRSWLPLVLFCFAFLFTLINLLAYTTLIGDDAAYHLADSLQNIKREPLRTSYPILFRALLAAFLQLTGASELPEALLLLKILASVISGFGVLATFIYVKEILGFPSALLSSFLISISLKNMQMLGWGGLPNFTSLALFPVILLMCLRNRGRKSIAFIFILTILSAFLFHYWSGAVLISIVALYHLFTLKRTGKRVILVISLVAIVVLLLNFEPIGGLFKSIYRRTIFGCTQREAFIHLGILWNGILGSLNLGGGYIMVIPRLAGIGLLIVIQRILKNERERRFYLMVVSWLLVPLVLLFFIIHPSVRNRLFYILTYPFFILFSITTISILQYLYRAMKLLTLLLMDPKKGIGRHLLPLALASLFTLTLISQSYGSMNMIGKNLQLYYPQSSNAIIDSIKWAQDFTLQNSTIISTTWSGPPWKKGPSRWMKLIGRTALRSMPILSDLTIEITTGTLRVYEGVFNHQENPRIEFHVVNPFKETNESMVSIREVNSMLSYNDSGTGIQIPLSEYQERIIQILTQSAGATWFVSHSTYEQFILTKGLHLRDDSSTIELYYNITANYRLEEAYLTINTLLPNITFNKVLLPGVLEWGSPWDKPTDLSREGLWASITSASDNMTERLVAYTNAMDNILTALRFDENPVSITVNSTEEGGIHESTLAFPLGIIQENQTKSIKIELGFSNLRSRWRPIDLEEVKGLFGARCEAGEIEVRGLEDTIELLSSGGPVYVMSEDEYLSPDFPSCTLFNRIYANDYIVAYQSKK